MADRSSREEEIRRLQRENRALGDQVRQLVRTERHLALSRQDLDRQLRTLQKLNRFALAASQAESRDDVLRLTLECLMSVFNFEQSAAYVEEGPSRYIKAFTHAVPGMEATRDQPPLWVSAPELPRSPVIGFSEEIAGAVAHLAPFIQNIDSIFEPTEQSKSASSFALLALPVRLKKECPKFLLLLRRLSLSTPFIEPLPKDSDIPFVNLVGSHASIAIQNLLSLKEANEAIQSRDEFLSIASHELKTPLTSVMLLLQTLLRRSQPEDSFYSTVAMIEKQCRRLGKLVDQLLDVSRIRVGKLKPAYQPFDFVALVRDVVSRSSEELVRSGSELALQGPPNLAMRGDPSQIEQVVTNLLTNSIKFGKGKPIRISVTADENRLKFEIKDQGIGIESGDQARIFDRFERGVSSRHFGGLGLGLYISRQIVDAHGGSMRVQSAHGEGSVFTLELPRRELADERP